MASDRELLNAFIEGLSLTEFQKQKLLEYVDDAIQEAHDDGMSNGLRGD